MLSFTPTLFSLLLAAPLISASPISNALQARDFSFSTLDFVFKGGPASYELSFPADGKTYPTNNDLSISLIDAGDFSAMNGCVFYGADGTALQGLAQSEESSDIAVGAPQPIKAVACLPSWGEGQCLALYGDCEVSSPTFGTVVLPCCPGFFCAATKCRSMS